MYKQVVRSKIKPVSEAEKAYGRTTTRIQVAAAIWILWDRRRKEDGVDQQWLADRMGKNKSWVSRLLKGPGNWTLDTVSDLLEAMEARLTVVEAHTYEEIEQNRAKISAQSRSRWMVEIKVMDLEIDDPERTDGTWPPAASVDLSRPLMSPIMELVESV